MNFKLIKIVDNGVFLRVLLPVEGKSTRQTFLRVVCTSYDVFRQIHHPSKNRF